MQRTTQLSECCVSAKPTENRPFRAYMHLDLAGQGPADIQMLYYYITSPAKLQAFFPIFCDSGKFCRPAPRDL